MQLESSDIGGTMANSDNYYETLYHKCSQNLIPILLTSTFTIVVCVFVYFEMMVTDPNASGLVNSSDLNGELEESKKLSLSLMISRSEMMATWSVGLIASFAFLFNHFRNKLSDISTFYFAVAAFIFILSFISIASSHIAYDITFRMLHHDEDPFTNDTVGTLLKCQYYTFLGAMITFVGFTLFLANSSNKE